MAFPDKLASTLTGASVDQIRRWRKRGIIVPEIQQSRPALYSFRDLAALRTIAYIRAKLSLQKISQGFSNLQRLDLTDHPSQYSFGTDGKGLTVQTGSSEVIELVGNTGQLNAFRMEEVFRPFTNMQGEEVLDFENPRPNLQLDRDRLAGWPTIKNTRVPYDLVASLLHGGDYSLDDIRLFFPNVSPEAARDAIAFDNLVEQREVEAA